MVNLDSGSREHIDSQQPQENAVAKTTQGKREISHTLIKKALEANEPSSPHPLSAKVIEKTGTSLATDQVYNKMVQYAEKAKVPREEVDRHIAFIATQLPVWNAGDKDVTVQFGAHTIVYISSSQTVISEFEGVVLGEGAFAKVQEAIVVASSSLSVGASVARKMAKGKDSNLETEAKITQEFNDSNNVRGCHTVNERGMLLEGMQKTLDEVVKENHGSIASVPIAKQLINGVSEIHAKGYVHNDLTMKNCFLSHSGVWKIGDLGSAGKTGQVNNRPVHLSIASPSQLAGQVFSAKTACNSADDIFAMGQLFYALEHGRPPDYSQSDTAKQLFEKIEEKRALLEKIKGLPNHEQEGILLQPDSTHELAVELRKLQSELRGLYKEYQTQVKEFVDHYEPSSDFGKLTKRMLEPNGDKRIDANDVLKALEGHELEAAVVAPKDSEIEDLGYSAPSFDLGVDSEDESRYSLPANFENPAADYATLSSTGIYGGTLEPEIEVSPLAKMDIEAFKALMRQGMDICGWQDDTGKTILHHAVKAKKPDTALIQFLLAHGADINATDLEGKPPLYYAVVAQNIQAARILVSEGADVDAADPSGRPYIVYDETSMGISYLVGDQYIESDIRFLDDTKLLMGLSKNKIDSIYTSWFHNQAITLEFLRDTPGVSEAAKKKLALLSLQAFDKAAAHSEKHSKALNFQMSPLFPNDARYHRSTSNEIIHGAEQAFANNTGITFSHDLRLVHSPLVLEAIERYAPKDSKTIKIAHENDLQQIIDELLVNPVRTKQNRLVVDFSELVASKGNDVGAVKSFKTLWNNFVNAHPDIPLTQNYVVPMSLFQYEGEHLIYTHGFHTGFLSELDDTLRHTGFVLSPDGVKEAWLKVSTPEEVFDTHRLALPKAVLATPGNAIPTLFNSIEDLLRTNACKQFRAMVSDPHATPYQRVLVEGTLAVLEGFRNYPVAGGIESVCKKHGLEGYLQLTYSKIQIGLANARFKKDDLIAFLNSIEEVHQQVQNLLAILSIEGGYSETAFGECVAKRLTEGPSPVVPADLPSPMVELKPSAMHGLSSILSSVEAQKGTNELNVAILKDTYYEETDVINHARTYNVSVFDSETTTFDKTPKSPIDLFVCEFHHNISLSRQEYKPEDVAAQVLHMHAKKMLADPCTVLIDTTIDLEKSDQMKALLHNPEIKKMIQDGKLNILFLRSGQKFDMLGMDNYYGGITTAINNGTSFSRFNERMAQKEDQQSGLSYQGMTHLQMHAGDAIEKYRQAIMQNCMKLYQALPKDLIFHSGTTNPVQISRIDDNRLVYLDIKTPGFKKLGGSVAVAFLKYARKEKLPVTARSSFGFATTNLTIIASEDGEKVRINPGLEGEKHTEAYVKFFEAIQAAIDEVMQDSQGLDNKAIEQKLIQAFKKIGG